MHDLAQQKETERQEKERAKQRKDRHELQKHIQAINVLCAKKTSIQPVNAKETKLLFAIQKE